MATMILSSPRSEAGQVLETEYGWHEGYLYRRIRTPGSHAQSWEESWARADDESTAALAEAAWHPGAAYDAPEVARWIPCVEPRDT